MEFYERRSLNMLHCTRATNCENLRSARLQFASNSIDRSVQYNKVIQVTFI